MKRLTDLWNALVNNAEKVIALPFLANLLLALADGHVSEQEFHSLVKGATQVDMVLLLVVILLMQFRKK